MAGNERFDKAMNQGHNAAWDQNWAGAASYYRQALEDAPDNPKALTSLALALYESGEYQEALVYYQKAYKLTPEDPIPLEKVAELFERTGKAVPAVEAFMQSAELYIKNRDINKAIDLWIHVTDLSPDFLAAHSRLALVYERLGRKQDAQREYFIVGSLYQHAGEVQKAAQTITHILQFFPESTEAQQALALLKMGRLLPRFSQTRNPSKPLRPIEPVPAPAPIPEEPEGPSENPVEEARQRALAELAEYLFESMDDESAGQANAQVDSKQIMIHLSQAVDTQTRKKNSMAIEELDQAISAGLDLPAAHFNLASLLFDATRLESAMRTLNRVVKTPAYALAGYLLMGQIHQKLERYKDASIALLEALRLADMQVVTKDQAQMLGQMYDPLIETQALADETSATHKLCDNLLDMLLRPNWKNYLREARQQLSTAGTDLISPLADALMEGGSGEMVDTMSNIQRLARSGKHRSAVEESFYALQASPMYLPLHVLMGDLLMQQGQFQQAVEKFMVVARSYSTRGESARAVGMYRRIADLSPMDMDARNRLIDLIIENEQYEEAINEYIRLADIYFSLADLNMVGKTFNQALRLAQQKNASRELRVKVLRRVADIDAQRLDWRQAMKSYEQIRNFLPEDEAARVSLIDMNFRLNQSSAALAEILSYVKYLVGVRNQDKALGFLERMAEEHPKQPQILRQLGEFYRQMGRTEDAIQKLDAVGELCLASGNREGAIEAIMAILAMNPPNVADYQRLLAQLRGPR